MTSRQHVKDYLPLIVLLASKKIKPHVKRTILQCVNLQDIICLCALNILKGNIALSQVQKTKLKKYRKLLLAISTKNCSRSKKAKNITKLQTGGFFPILGTLLGSIAPTIIKGIAGLFGQ